MAISKEDKLLLLSIVLGTGIGIILTLFVLFVGFSDIICIY